MTSTEPSPPAPKAYAEQFTAHRAAYEAQNSAGATGYQQAQLVLDRRRNDDER